MSRCNDCKDFLNFHENVDGVVGVCENPLNYMGDSPREVMSIEVGNGCEFFTPKVVEGITCPHCGCTIHVGLAVRGFDDTKQRAR